MTDEVSYYLFECHGKLSPPTRAKWKPAHERKNIECILAKYSFNLHSKEAIESLSFNYEGDRIATFDAQGLVLISAVLGNDPVPICGFSFAGDSGNHPQ